MPLVAGKADAGSGGLDAFAFVDRAIFLPPAVEALNQVELSLASETAGHDFTIRVGDATFHIDVIRNSEHEIHYLLDGVDDDFTPEGDPAYDSPVAVEPDPSTGRRKRGRSTTSTAGPSSASSHPPARLAGRSAIRRTR